MIFIISKIKEIIHFFNFLIIYLGLTKNIKNIRLNKFSINKIQKKVNKIEIKFEIMQ